MEEIENVLVKIGEFIFSANFIVLETKPVPNPQHHILATSKINIYCRSGSIAFLLETWHLDLNIFNLRHQPTNPLDEPLDVNAIQSIFSEHLEDELFDELDSLADESLFSDENDESSMCLLPPEPLTSEPRVHLHPSIEYPPKLEMKTLPSHLKYTF